MKGRTGAVRQQALKAQDLNAAERHGKRQDKTSEARKVTDMPPLVYGSLDLAEARRKHVDGAKQQGKTAAIHMIVQYPTALPLGDTPEDRERSHKGMLREAVRFANAYHGGRAVFAARLDRDESGQHTVDVFLLPKHTFKYKDGRTEERVIVSKFSKENATKLLGRDDPRAQGQALQRAWFEFMRDELKLTGVQPPEPKKSRLPDRLEPEEYKLREDQKKLAEDRKALAKREAQLEALEREARIALAYGRSVAERYHDKEAVETIRATERKFRVRDRDEPR